jgi:AraC family transcriptional regulator, ethanolamine operon transcriptional activator
VSATATTTAQIFQASPVSPAPMGRRTCQVVRLAAGTIIHVNTSDFEEFRHFTLGWNIDHQLISAQKTHIRVVSVMTKNIQLARVQHLNGYSSQGEGPKGTVSIAVPLDEARPMIHRGRVIDPMEIGVHYNGEAYELTNRNGADHILATFSLARFEKYADDIWREPCLWRRKSSRFRFRDSAQRLLCIEEYHTALGDVQKQPIFLQSPHTAALLEDMLLENLLLRCHVSRRYENDRNRHRVARRAYRHLLDNIEEMPSIHQLCSITGASYMTLERGFREMYGMAPQKQIKELRLSRARRELLHPTSITTVTGVAVRWGFFELGRFSSYYRARFGETPSETLRKAREEPWLTPGKNGQFSPEWSF